ncbi:MAG TPA: cupin domain-containing protein [Gaiellaceae bacterium]
MPGSSRASSNQEDFLVLEGECVAVIEGETRALRQWDFVHCPPGTRHSFVGAGDGCCVLLAVGSRGSRRLRYHPTPHAESVSAPTENAADAYAPYGHWAGDAASPL